MNEQRRLQQARRLLSSPAQPHPSSENARRIKSLSPTRLETVFSLMRSSAKRRHFISHCIARRSPTPSSSLSWSFLPIVCTINSHTHNDASIHTCEHAALVVAHDDRNINVGFMIMRTLFNTFNLSTRLAAVRNNARRHKTEQCE